MSIPLNLFHCRTSEGDRAYEDRFQTFLFLCNSEKELKPVLHPQVRKMIDRVKENYRDYEALTFLAKVLADSLEREAYDQFVSEFSAVLTFYDAVIALGGIVDRERTKELHCPKYCLYKFASFLAAC